MSSGFTSTPEQSFVGRKNHQTGTCENACEYDTDDGHRLEELTDRFHRTEGDHRNYSCRRKKMSATYSCLVQGDKPRTEGKYSTRTRAVTRKWNERTTQLAVIIAENIWRLLPDTRRRRGRVKQIKLDGIQRTHGPLKEMPTATNVRQASQV